VFCKKISDSELKILMKTYIVNILMCQCVASLFESKHVLFDCLKLVFNSDINAPNCWTVLHLVHLFL